MTTSIVALCLMASGADAAAGRPANQLTIDVDAASVGVTYARRLRPWLLVGGGFNVGPSPLLGTWVASNEHFDPVPNVYLLELASLEVLVRLLPAHWLSVDAGLRGGAFAHGGENATGGSFTFAFVYPSVGWRWFWIGPRVSAGRLHESYIQSSVLEVDYLRARVAFSW